MPMNISDPAHRHIIIVEWGKRDTANQQAAAWDPDTDGGNTFGSVKLSADGTDPPSHSACNTVATNDMNTAIVDAMSQVPFVDVYDLQDGETVGELWERALTDQDLKVIEPEL